MTEVGQRAHNESHKSQLNSISAGFVLLDGSKARAAMALKWSSKSEGP